MMTWYASTSGKPTHVIPVIHISESSEDAALIAVMAGPALSADATTRFGNMEAASNPTSIAAETDWARNAPRSQFFLSAKKIDAPIPPRTKIANTQRSAPRRDPWPAG